MLNKTLTNKKKTLPLTLAGMMLLVLSVTGTASAHNKDYNNNHYANTYNNEQHQYNSEDLNHEEKMAEYIKLRSLLQEHAALAGAVTVNRYDNKPEFEDSKNAAVMNGEMLAELVGEKYGEEVKSEFSSQWVRHLDLYVQYTDALKNNDSTLKESTVAELMDFTEKTSELLSRDGMIPQDVVRTELQTHVTLAAAVIDAHAAGDYNTQYMKMHEAYEHAGMMADKLVLSHEYNY